MKKLTLCFKPSDLAAILREIEPFMSREATRYYICGIFFEISESGKLRMTATDGHKLITKDIGERHVVHNDFAGSEVSFIAADDSIKSMLLALRLKRHAVVAEIIFEQGDKQALFFSVDGITIHSKPIDGTFPNYNKVIPEREHAFTIGLGAPQAQQLLKASVAYPGAKWCFGATEFEPVALEAKGTKIVVMPMRV